MNQTVSLVTKDATLDDLSMGDYRDIFDELRPIDPKTGNRLSLDKFIASIKSQWSKALWGRYDNGEPVLNRSMRSELRVGVGLPPLPLTIEQATAQASPDASVWKVGEGTPEHVIMVGNEQITLHVNSGVSVVHPERHVTKVTVGQVQREYTARPYVSKTQKARFLALPVRSWSEVIDVGLAAMENESEVNPYLLIGAELERTEKATW